MNEDAEGNVLAQLFCKRKYGTYVSIVWCPGFTALDNPCEKFDNKIKWKANYNNINSDNHQNLETLDSGFYKYSCSVIILPDTTKWRFGGWEEGEG